MTGFLVEMTDKWLVTKAYRFCVTRRIEIAIQNCPYLLDLAKVSTVRSPAEMEDLIFAKAKSKHEYLSFSARLLYHIGEKAKLNQPPVEQNVVEIEAEANQPIQQE